MDAKSNYSFFKDIIISQSIAISSLISLNFLEVIKVLQIQDQKNCSIEHYIKKSEFSKFEFSKNKLLKIPKKKFSDCVDCLPHRNAFRLFFYINRTYGMTHLMFSGLSNSLISHILRSGLFLPLYEKMDQVLMSKSFCQNDVKQRKFIASIMARGITTFISFPFELKKVIKQIYINKMHIIRCNYITIFYK